MKRSTLRGCLLALLTLAICGLPEFSAAPTAQQNRKAKTAETALKKTKNLMRSKKYPAAGEALRQAQTLIGELAADGADGARLAAPLYKQLEPLHGDLELQNVKLDPLPAAPAAPSAAGSPGDVSFTKQVAPMLVGKCGNCHIRADKGGFNMKSFTDLMKGSKDGVVIFPGKGADSRIVELIQNKDMPRGGSVSDQELALLTKWIDQGAKFDGPNKDASLGDASAAPAAGAPTMAKVDVAMATGKESIHFVLDIGPVLVAQCYSCHGEGRQAAARYDMDDFKGVLKGGDSGQAVKPGDAAGSLIIKKLRGTAADGVRMPKDKPPLPDDVIAKFEKWISEGAKFDGFDVNASLRDVVAVAHAEKVTHEELTAERAALADHNWRLILPDAPTDREETANFVIYGNVSKDELKEVGKIAEAQGVKLAKLLKLPPGPLVKGRTTIYVFDKKYDYGEVGRMLEKRELPSDWRSHWTYNIVDAYICIVPAKNNEYSLSGMIGQQLAGVLVASQGHVPRWFAEGSARNIVARLDSRDARPRQWDDDAAAVLSSGLKPDGFLTGGGPDYDLISYLFVKPLISDSARYQRLLAAVREQMPFDAAFAKAYGKTPAQMVASMTYGRK